MSRRTIQSPRAIARATGLPLVDVLDELDRAERIGPLASEYTRITLRVWDDEEGEARSGEAYDHAGDR